MDEAAVRSLERLVELAHARPHRTITQRRPRCSAGSMPPALGAVPVTEWKNLSELDQIVDVLLGRRPRRGGGRPARTGLPAGRTDVGRSPTGSRPSASTSAAPTSPGRSGPRPGPPARPAVRDARVAVTHLVEGDLRRRPPDVPSPALAADPDLFEAHYGLAVLEHDAGRAEAEPAAALRPRNRPRATWRARSAREIAAFVRPYAAK